MEREWKLEIKYLVIFKLKLYKFHKFLCEFLDDHGGIIDLIWMSNEMWEMIVCEVFKCTNSYLCDLEYVCSMLMNPIDY